MTSDKEEYLRKLSAKARQYADRVANSEISAQYASLDLLSTIFLAIEEGLDNSEITVCYPVASWREDTVEVPRALLRPIVESWMEYQSGSKKLGEAFNVEGGGQGRRSVRNTEKTNNRDQRLSNRVVYLLLQAEGNGRPISQDAAFQTVVEESGVNYETVRKAFQRLGSDAMNALEPLREKLRDNLT